MADELWNRFVYALQCEGLLYEDLPDTQVLLYGTLKELRFPSMLDRTKLKKQMFQITTGVYKWRAAYHVDPRPCVSASATIAEYGKPTDTNIMSIRPAEDHMGSPDQFSSTTTQDTSACENLRLTDTGLRGLEAACRSAFEIVTVACNEEKNVSL